MLRGVDSASMRQMSGEAENEANHKMPPGAGCPGQKSETVLLLDDCLMLLKTL